MWIRNFWRWLNFRLFVSCQLTQSRPSTSRGMLVPQICSFQVTFPLSCQCTYCTTHIVIIIIIIIVLQDISGKHLNKGSNKAQDARLDIHACGFWERHRSAMFDVTVCHPNAVSYRDLKPQQIYHIRDNEKKRLYSGRVLDIEHGAFTPLVFTTTGGMGTECLMYHSRLAQLIAIKKGEQYAKTIYGSEPKPHSHS